MLLGGLAGLRRLRRRRRAGRHRRARHERAEAAERRGAARRAARAPRPRAAGRAAPARYAATATGAQRRARPRARPATPPACRCGASRSSRARSTSTGDRAVLRVRSGYGDRGHPRALRGRARPCARGAPARGWRIASSTSRRAAPSVGDRPLRRAPHAATSRSSRRPRSARDGLDDALEDGYARMRDVLVTGVLRRRYLVVVAGDAAQARRMTTGIRGVATLAAISDSAVREEGPADRVVQVVLAAAARRLAARSRRSTPTGARARRHARAHPRRARRATRRGARPAGCVEGDRALRLRRPPRRRGGPLVAGDAGRVSRRALTLTGLSAPGAIGRLGGEGQSAAYAYSSAAAFYIAERFGRKRFLRLYDAFNDPALTEPEGAELTAAAVRRALGIGAARARARPAALDRHARGGRPVRAVALNRPCPSCPRSRRSAATWRPTSRGARSSASRSSTRAGAARSRRASSPTRVEGRTVERLGRRGKYLVWELEGEAYLLVHLRMTGTLLLDPDEPAHNRVWFELGDHRLAFTDPRRFGTGRAGARARTRWTRSSPRGSASSRSSDGFTAEHLHALARALARADQGVPARPEARRRRRQHLRRRGAVPRAHPPAAAGEPAHARAVRGAARRGRRVAGGGDRGQGRHDRRLPRPLRRQRHLPGPSSSIHLREGEPCPNCGRPGAQAARRRARDLRLRALPAAPRR